MNAASDAAADKPVVTIGITAYNAADTVERAVASARAQTWRPTEIVVVDDCSSDETPAVLTRLAAGHTDVRVFREAANGGVAAARNRIVQQAQGEFITFFDDDDSSEPNRVAQQLTRILTYERYHAEGAPVICHTARRQVFADGSVRLVPTMGIRADRPAPAGWAVAERVLIGTPLKDVLAAVPRCAYLVLFWIGVLPWIGFRLRLSGPAAIGGRLALFSRASGHRFRAVRRRGLG